MTTTPTTLPLTVLTMSFPDPENSSNTLPATIWWPQFIGIDGAGKVANVLFTGFRDESAFLAWFGDATKAIPIGQHSYPISGSPFLTMYAAILADQLSLAAAVFSLTTTLDINTGKSNADGTQLMASFFAGATQATIQVPV